MTEYELIPELITRGPAGTYAIGDLKLPIWFTEKHAKKVFENEYFQKNMQLFANNYWESFSGRKINDSHFHMGVQLTWTQECGLQNVRIPLSDCACCGIDGNRMNMLELTTGTENHTSIYNHNIDTLPQLVTLYSTWVRYLNLVRFFRED